MSERKGPPPLSRRPPGPRNVEEFMEAAERPRESPAEASPADKIPADKIPAAEGGVAPMPWETAEGGARFPLRLSAKHHAMLQWLAQVTPRKSMNDWILDLLEPAIEEAVRRKREELGV